MAWCLVAKQSTPQLSEMLRKPSPYKQLQNISTQSNVKATRVVKPLISVNSSATFCTRLISPATFHQVRGIHDECDCEEMPNQNPEDETRFWHILTYYVCLPAILVGTLLLLRNPEHPERPEFKQYEYMRIRTRPFPWGDGNHSLFHNPRVNALPEGYEDELEGESEDVAEDENGEENSEEVAEDGEEEEEESEATEE